MGFAVDFLKNLQIGNSSDKNLHSVYCAIHSVNIFGGGIVCKSLGRV